VWESFLGDTPGASLPARADARGVRNGSRSRISQCSKCADQLVARSSTALQFGACGKVSCPGGRHNISRARYSTGLVGTKLSPDHTRRAATIASPCRSSAASGSRARVEHDTIASLGSFGLLVDQENPDFLIECAPSATYRVGSQVGCRIAAKRGNGWILDVAWRLLRGAPPSSFLSN
jgi:hypothetical protein